jgi:hypothetical protein
VTLASGTLADLDLASIAATTSLGRSSLRLELRTAGGELIGSLVLKAGRIVSATAGGARGRDALRVIMNAGSDTRFQLAHEPLEFAMSSALASVDELGKLARGSSPANLGGPSGGPSDGGEVTRSDLPSLRPRSAPPVTRVPMMEGQLDEFDLLTLLQTIGLGRQLVEIELRDRAGAPLGAVRVKSSKIMSARAGDADGLPALAELIGSRACVAFAAFRVAGEFDRLPELASVSEVSVRFAPPAPEQADRTVAEGTLAEFDIPTILHTLGSSRQYYALEIHDELTTAGAIFIKSGIVQAATAGELTGLRAIQHLIASHPHDRFRLVQLAGELPEQVPLGPISRVLLSVDAPAPPTARSPGPPAGSPRAPEPVPGEPAAAPVASEPVLMQGKLSDFDVRTVLEVLAATRQHARLQILDPGQPPLGEIALKAGQIMSGRAGNLRGRDALVLLLGAPRQLWFRVVTGSQGLEPQEPLGSIHELLAGIEIAGARRPQASTRALRWAIPLSVAVGGAIVFVAIRGWNTGQPAQLHATPAGNAAPAAEATAPPAPPTPRPAPPTPTTAPPPAGAATTAPASPTEAPASAKPPETPPPAQPAETPPSAQPAETPPPAQPAETPPPVQPAETPPPVQPAETPPPAPARRSGGISIKNAQAALKRLGYDPGPIDNAYGRQTRSAIMQFQRSQHLPVSGFLDRDTWSAIVGQLIP